ncbi:MAG: cytochrome c [Methylophilus sp.]|jgi:cytochrome c553|uniref:c-type cytochrome n=1 Tax=Methylophilus sp. TaxID=29541 RepID=UPI002CE506F7|nr:c-type cytochrome [Methylophilus sp.]HSH85857.1 c-type cytochrome [Methylophilus sp.]
MLKSFKAGLCALLAIGLTIAIQPAFAEEAATTEAAPEVNSPDKVVQNVCAACHGADGNSVITTNPKLAGQHPEYLLKQLSNFKDGSRANAVMSGMASALSQEDMEGIAKYFSNQSIKLAKAKENGKGSLGEKIYRGGIAANKVPACAACHGVTGAGLPKQFPRLAGQHTDYTVQQLRTFRTGERANAPMMMAIAAKMSDAEMQAVADYIQGLR